MLTTCDVSRMGENRSGADVSTCMGDVGVDVTSMLSSHVVVDKSPNADTLGVHAGADVAMCEHSDVSMSHVMLASSTCSSVTRHDVSMCGMGDTSLSATGLRAVTCAGVSTHTSYVDVPCIVVDGARTCAGVMTCISGADGECTALRLCCSMYRGCCGDGVYVDVACAGEKRGMSSCR